METIEALVALNLIPGVGPIRTRHLLDHFDGDPVGILRASQAELDRVNKKFARVEQIKKFWLLDTQLSAEDEELTPTMKLKRKLVEKKYAPQIEAMYR